MPGSPPSKRAEAEDEPPDWGNDRPPRAASNTTDAGLRIVLGVAEMAELARLRRRVQELKEDAALAGDAKIVCPVLAATPGELFTHHTMDANHADWDEDVFEFLGRADGSSKTPAGWLLFRHLEIGRGICAYGCAGGLNGGMRDAIGAWPMTAHFNYRPGGGYDEHEIALPLEMCWGFRVAREGGEEEDEDDDN
jgi:hypothetical protein